MSVKRTLSVAALAIVALLALASSALAASITLNRQCYVSPKIGLGTTIDVTGTGFTPGEAVFAQIPAPAGLLSFTETTVGPEGSFSAQLTHVLPAGINPVAEDETMQIKGVLSGAILAQSPFQLTNLAVQLHPASARPHKKVSYHFAGFSPHKPIYGHYLHAGKVVSTHRFGRARGACGLLTARAPIYPGRSRFSRYTVQFDQSKRYNKHASPKIDTSVTILRF